MSYNAVSLVTNSWTKATGITALVDGVAGLRFPILSGVIVDIVGYDATGSPVYQKAPVIADFWRSGTVALPLLPDGTTDTSELIVRIGKTGFGTDDPNLIQATIDNFGTFTTRGTTVANAAAFYIMSGLVSNTQAAIMITQTVTDAVLSVDTPLGQTAFGRYFRVHNDSASTFNLIYRKNIIQPGTFLDLQWNGTAWAPEGLYQPDGFPRSGTQSVGGVIAPGATSYNDVNTSMNATVTLPTAVGRRNEVFTVNHFATPDSILLGTNKSPATSLTLSAANRVTQYISDGANWRATEQPFSGNITSMVSNALPTAVLPVGGLFEISMPASTDVRIRSLVARQVYITSEGEYNGGSFSTTTAAIVNLTTTAVPADNNVHVAGEKNIITIQDVLTNRIFQVTVWRFGAVAGNWSGWAEEIGVATIAPVGSIPAYTTNALAVADTTLAVGSEYTVLVGGFKQLFIK